MLPRYALIILLVFPELAAQGATPIDAYGRLPAIEKVALSPTGSTVAMEETRDDGHFLSVISLDSDKLLSGLRLGEAKVRSIEWADDEHLLITTASAQLPIELYGRKIEWRTIEAYDVRERKLRPLMVNVISRKRTMNVVFGSPVILRKDNATVLLLHGVFFDPKAQVGLFEVNLTTGIEQLLKEGGETTSGWAVDDSGQIAAEEEYVESQKAWSIKLFRDGRPVQTVSGVAPIDIPRIVGVSGTGDALIVEQREASGLTWRPLSLRDGSWGSDFRETSGSNELVQARGSPRVIGTAFVDDKATYHFVDRKLQEGWDWVARSFHSDRVELESMSDDGARMVVRVFGPTSGFAYYVADVGERYTRRVGTIYPGVTQIAQLRKIRYAAADGLAIPAYVTLPPGRDPKRLPLIAFPHGGPQAHDRFDFDWWAQAMAAQGYAVLQPNYRGSDLGVSWVERGYGEWGRKMQTDVSDGVRYLVKEGMVDPARVCIVGASYGGYAALAGVTLESGVYRCAVAVAGVSDLGRMLTEFAVGARQTSQPLRYWERFLRADGPDDPRIDEISPLKHAQNASAPILLIHGKEDTTVPYYQSEAMAKALKRAGKPVELVSLAKEGHHLSMSPTRQQMLTALTDFLRRNNPPD